MSRRQVGWRFPEALVRRVENYAERERRSVNRAAEVLLEQALEAAEKDREGGK